MPEANVVIDDNDNEKDTPMPRNLYVNLPVQDLDRTVDFFAELGFAFNPTFTDENARYAEPKDHGFMYQRGIADLDGHQWEVFYMDEAQFPTQ